MSVTLTDEQLAQLLEFFDRWHTSTCDPKFVGQTIKRGERIMDELQAIAAARNPKKGTQ
jgi:hypothetical protein